MSCRSQSCSDAGLDERFVPHAAHPQLRLFFHLAVLDAECAIALFQVLGIVINASLHHFEDVPTEATAEGLRELSNFRVVDDLVKLGNKCAWS